MEGIDFIKIFQGLEALQASEPGVIIGRIALIILGIVLIVLGKKQVLEPLLMIPMGIGMICINSGTLVLPNGNLGNLFLDPFVSETTSVVDLLQINFLQPIYTLMFSNGLIACLVFMGIGVLLDVGFLLSRPFLGMFLAVCAELGSFLTIPIAMAMGFDDKSAASIAIIGGADGPMVMFTSLVLKKELFVPITVVAYLYLGFTYGGYPYLIKLMIPERLRGLPVPARPVKKITSNQKTAFAVVASVILSILFPVAAPLFMSLFLGVAIRESGLKHLIDFIGGPLLYGSTFFLGLMLGVLCDASILLDPKVFLLLILGIVALLLSGIGGILGDYIVYFLSGKKINPVVGIAGVSCVPTTAKVAQKSVSEMNQAVIILPDAIAANISGVITTAIIAGLFISVFG